MKNKIDWNPNTKTGLIFGRHVRGLPGLVMMAPFLIAEFIFCACVIAAFSPLYVVGWLYGLAGEIKDNAERRAS